jgi:molecular chaperone GrpE
MNTRPEKDQDIDRTTVSEETDTEIEDIDLAEEDALSADKIKRMRQQLRDCQEDKMATLEELQRVKADFLNAKKNLQAQALRDTERAEERLLVALLPLCDSFTEAMKDTAVWESIAPEWRRGVEGIHQQLLQLLGRYQVTSIDPLHQPFDPSLHEALASEASTYESDTVITVLQPGYLRNGVVIRPAKVIISA